VKAEIDPGLAHSMAIRRQRIVLDEVGREVGTRVVYLKAAWADPVLYGGRGARLGVDVDVLVSASKFEAFAQALARRGFRRQEHPAHPVSAFVGKDWTFDAPAGFVPVDLHRSLAVPPWFDLPGAGPLDRAREYESLDGPILSLSPEDQVVFLAAHYGTHVFDLDDRHLGDVVRLLRTHAVDWLAVEARGREAGLSVVLALCLSAIRAQGIDLPARLLAPSGGAFRARWLQRFVDVPALARRRRWPRQLELLLLMPALSDRPTALPRFLARYLRYRIADLLAPRIDP